MQTRRLADSISIKKMRAVTMLLLLACVVASATVAQARPLHKLQTSAAADVAAVAPTTATTSCGFGGLDFSSLTGSVLGATDAEGNDYLLSICAALSSSSSNPLAKSCLTQGADAAACQALPQGGPAFDLGGWNTAEWSYVQPAFPNVGVQVRTHTEAAASLAVQRAAI